MEKKLKTKRKEKAKSTGICRKRWKGQLPITFRSWVVDAILNFGPSQICSCCGSRRKLKLSERVYSCSCGLKIDRDLNAAINIKNEGLRLLSEVS